MLYSKTIEILTSSTNGYLTTMRIAIVYFSGTGTTAYFATEIATGFREAGHEVQLFRFNQIQSKALMDYDLIGFGTPTYCWHAVRKFDTFLKTGPVDQKPYFLFCTCGGQPGNTIWDMYMTLKRRAWIYMGPLS